MTLDRKSGSDQHLIFARGLKKHFRRRGDRNKEVLRAVDGVDLYLDRGETLGIVGESGCGKTTLARLILQLEEPTAGELRYKGTEVREMSRAERRVFRRNVQVVFQDPYVSLDPRMTVGEIISEGWRIHRSSYRGVDQNRRACELLEQVGLDPAYVKRYPHEFSGGQRQRIGIARALALEPEVVVCDEPVSALDVSVQAQIIRLLNDLQERLGLSYIFVAHDLSVVRHISDRVMVMYLGKIAERGSADALYEHAAHPYSQALLSAAPDPDPSAERRKRIVLSGDIPNPADPPSGCSFRTRCWRSDDRCRTEVPDLIDRDSDEHAVACHFPAEGGMPEETSTNRGS